MHVLYWAILFLIGLLLLHWSQMRSRSRNAFTFDTFCYPIIGHSLQVLKMRFQMLETLLGAAIANGAKTSQLQILGQPLYILVADPICVKHILSDNFENYEKGEFFRDKFTELLGDGIFNVDGLKWHVHRKLSSNIFKRDDLQGFMTMVFLEHGHQLLDILDKYAESGQEFDLQNLFFKYTLDTIAKIAFGVDFDCLKEGTSQFSTQFDIAQNILQERMVLPDWPLRKYLWFLYSDERLVRKAISALDKEAKEIIRQRRNDQKITSRSDLLSLFLTHNSDENKPFSDNEIRDVIMNFVIAGRDTTAVCLTWSFHELCKNKNVEQKLVEEIQNVLGSNLPTYDDVHNNLPYLHAVVKETLRKYPSVPKDGKMAVSEDYLPDGTHVPKGAVVVYLPYVMGRLESLWPQAHIFNPERWLNGQPEPSAFKFIAFNAGPRTCLGQRMAYTEAEILIAMILQKFQIIESPGQSEESPISLTMPKKDGLKVRVKRRNAPVEL